MDKQPKWMTITGWVLSVLVTLMLLMSGVLKLAMPGAEKGFTDLGYPAQVAVPIAIVELLCALLYIFPRTAPLGAILVAGYLGGAIATHVRVEEMFVVQFLIGVVAWLGLFFRERRVRAILPWMPAEPNV